MSLFSFTLLQVFCLEFYYHSKRRLEEGIRQRHVPHNQNNAQPNLTTALHYPHDLEEPTKLYWLPYILFLLVVSMQFCQQCEEYVVILTCTLSSAALQTIQRCICKIPDPYVS